jgi:hypothetical protein
LLKPEDMDFISNFSTVWAVFLGAILATLGGFAATQMEWQIERVRRERNAALFFGEVLQTLCVLLNMADESRAIGDPYGPITLRMLRSALREIDIYNRNRETLYDIRKAELRARVHTQILRITMSCDGVFDSIQEISATRLALRAPDLSLEHRQEYEDRLRELIEFRKSGFDFAVESGAALKNALRELEPIAHYSFDRIDRVARSDA